MKCHYKVLDVETDADESQIKAAYRKLALKWHPDKNLDNVEYAKEQFQVVQQAYEVLSDRQERAWYDKHKDHILYGRDYQDSALDVFQYFTTSCFKFHNDGPNGFYTVYREVFEKIAAEDAEHADEDADSDAPPTFGFADSDYDGVVGPFYAYWTTYNTKRSYSWLNPHNIQEVRDRRVFKLMEKENKKVRQKAKKERNEEVRALVAFVKKRDVRVRENSKRLEAKVAQNRQKQEELTRQKRLERRKELDDAKPIAEWAKFDNVESELKGIEKDLAKTFGDNVSSDESQDEFDDNLFCVACNKLFKTAKGYENHEISKKHKQNVKLLKKTMTAENHGSHKTHSTDDDVTTDEESKPVEKKKTKKPKNILKTVRDSDSDIDNSFILDENKEEESNHFSEVSTKKQKRKSKAASVRTEVNGAPAEHIANNQTNKKGKAKDRAKSTDQVVVSDRDRICITCGSEFPSKNKLFLHLKNTNHGIYLKNTKSKE